MPSHETEAQPPPHVERFVRASGVGVADVRWCRERGCRTVAYAIDGYQRAALRRAGFTDQCPDCRGLA